MTKRVYGYTTTAMYDKKKEYTRPSVGPPVRRAPLNLCSTSTANNNPAQRQEKPGRNQYRTQDKECNQNLKTKHKTPLQKNRTTTKRKENRGRKRQPQEKEKRTRYEDEVEVKFEIVIEVK